MEFHEHFSCPNLDDVVSDLFQIHASFFGASEILNAFLNVATCTQMFGYRQKWPSNIFAVTDYNNYSDLVEKMGTTDEQVVR
jgi:hypothetical protein